MWEIYFYKEVRSFVRSLKFVIIVDYVSACIMYMYYEYTSDWETNKTLCDTKDKLETIITPEFTNLNKETVGKAYRRFRIRLEAMVETNGDFF